MEIDLMPVEILTVADHKPAKKNLLKLNKQERDICKRSKLKILPSIKLTGSERRTFKKMFLKGLSKIERGGKIFEISAREIGTKRFHITLKRGQTSINSRVELVS